MANITVGISDLALSKNREDTIITYSLGSCLGVTVFDPESGVGGMVHCQLPTCTSEDKTKATTNPAMFVDTGVTLLFQKFFEMGGSKARMIVKAAGCAAILDSNGFFRIGERNVTLFKKLMWKNGIILKGSETGGDISRTLVLNMETGRTTIRSKGEEREL
ncbi:MAG: chemotaxis protein CheD [Chitinispirillia bacterium]|nr:chemotaxis protein CheD [Chitinispirillia bacterium]MCL2242676.1 chemotaxis protein CheD [Chitinispirillia bacterium]